MAGLVGSAGGGPDLARKAPEKIRHRGKGSTRIIETEYGCLGEVTSGFAGSTRDAGSRPVVLDGDIYNWRELAPDARTVHEAVERLYLARGPEFVRELDGPFALAILTPRGPFLARGRVGVAPLYYGLCEGKACFASEVKALLDFAQPIREFLPGNYFDSTVGMVSYAKIEKRDPVKMTPEEAALKLRARLSESVSKRIAASGEDMGSLLSGGLDSSAMAALAMEQVGSLKTFAVGTPGAPDLEHARAVADFIGCDHRELVVDLDDMLGVLPDVIYHLESFDALLVRSSVTNYLVGKLASDYVSSVLSGEGGDELFAGYEYLKSLKSEELADELVDITNRLHNTALQRVDRCSQAHGLVAHTGFLDLDVIDYALCIPPGYKLYRNGGAVEKWVLRRAMDGMLPESVLDRPKAKFWEGAGVEDLIERYVAEKISDDEFARERVLPNGETLNSKEELHYYRIFKEHFGEHRDLSFMGRTKGAPVA